MGLLDGGLQRVARGAFGSLLLKGKIRFPTDPEAPTGEERDARGRITRAAEASEVPLQDCRAFFDKVTTLMRANGYAGTDVQIVCLQLTPGGDPIPRPQEGTEIFLRGEWYAAAEPISADAAAAAWTFRGTLMSPQPQPPPA